MARRGIARTAAQLTGPRYTIRRATSPHCPDWFRVFDEMIRESDDSHEFHYTDGPSRYNYPVRAVAKERAGLRAEQLNHFWERTSTNPLPQAHLAAIDAYIDRYNAAMGFLQGSRALPEHSELTMPLIGVAGEWRYTASHLIDGQLSELRAELNRLHEVNWHELADEYRALRTLVLADLERGPDAAWHALPNNLLYVSEAEPAITLPEGSVVARRIENYRSDHAAQYHLAVVIITAPGAEALYEVLPVGPRLDQHLAPVQIWDQRDNPGGTRSSLYHASEPQAIVNVATSRACLLQTAIAKAAAGEPLADPRGKDGRGRAA